jgi:hypothetical protein
MKIQFLVPILCLVLLGTTGCRTVYGPKKPALLNKGVTPVFNYTTPGATNYYLDQYARAMDKYDEPVRSAMRDRILFDLINQVDVTYNDSEEGLRNEKLAKDMLADFAVIGINAAGTITGTAGTKAILHAVSGGLVAANAATEKIAFKEKAIEALQLQMQAMRKEQYAVLLENMKKDTGKYPLEAGIRDVIEYYYRGTLPRAFQALFEQAGSKGEEANRQIKKAASPASTNTAPTNPTPTKP